MTQNPDPAAVGKWRSLFYWLFIHCDVAGFWWCITPVAIPVSGEIAELGSTTWIQDFS